MSVPYVVVMTVSVEIPKKGATSMSVMNALNRKCNEEMHRRPGLMPIGSPYPMIGTVCRDLVWQAIDREEGEEDGQPVE